MGVPGRRGIFQCRAHPCGVGGGLDLGGAVSESSPEKAHCPVSFGRHAGHGLNMVCPGEVVCNGYP